MKKYLSVLKSQCKISTDFFFDCKRYINNSYYRNKSASKDIEHLEGMIIRLYHGVEKGLSVSAFKKEFGLGNITLLQELLLQVKNKKFSNNHIESAIVTLNKYYEKHEDVGSELFERNKKEYYESIYTRVHENGGTKLYDITEDVSSLNYKEFFNSRQSVREFLKDDALSESTIVKILDIAKNCPSACNRQAMKIYYSIDPEKNAELLSYQNGSRTFRHAVPGVFIVCSDTRFQEGAEERNLGFIEGGIWILSLINAIHYMKLGSCVLNWCVRSKHDILFRKKFNIPSYYNISAMIAFGSPSAPQKTPYSIRRKSNDFIEKIK